MPVPQFDTEKKFVRINQTCPNGFIEFEFSVGEPEVYVELVLPLPAFKQFCISHQVQLLEPRQDELATDWDWRMQQASREGIKKAAPHQHT